jgi:hypothetical protein
VTLRTDVSNLFDKDIYEILKRSSYIDDLMADLALHGIIKEEKFELSLEKTTKALSLAYEEYKKKYEKKESLERMSKRAIFGFFMNCMSIGS